MDTAGIKQSIRESIRLNSVSPTRAAEASRHFFQGGNHQPQLANLLYILQQLVQQIVGAIQLGTNDSSQSPVVPTTPSPPAPIVSPGPVQNPPPQLPKPPNIGAVYSANGKGNNLANPSWGAADTAMGRLTDADPSRKPNRKSAAHLPSAREVSNAVSNTTEKSFNHKNASDMFWLWGQFLDHDITEVKVRGKKTTPIDVPKGDKQFDPMGTGEVEIAFNNSKKEKVANGDRNPVNHITGFIDGSNVYGSSSEKTDRLRSFEGGELKLDKHGNLKKNKSGFFKAGDDRANENVGLTAMHTIWAREHNRIAKEYANRFPQMSDEQLFQAARKKVTAQMQAITYNEFLPILLGEDALSKYQGYDKKADPSITAEFASAAYRFGHSMLSPKILRLDEHGNEIEAGHLSLKEAFFQPETYEQTGVDSLMYGLAAQTARAIDPEITNPVRNFLFGQPGAGGFDLAALNIQRGRDHAVAGYSDVRKELGLGAVKDFDAKVWQNGYGERFESVYGKAKDIDLWAGGLAEKAKGDGLVGETFHEILATQFEALRNGDRLWYENQFSGQELEHLNELSLADVIRRNSDAKELQDNVMIASNAHRGGRSPV